MTTPNTITDLIPAFYYNMNVVSRELVGLIPSISLDASKLPAAKNQTIRSFVAPAAQAYDIEPGPMPVDDGNQDFDKVDMAITYVKRVPIVWNGDEELSLDAPGGPGSDNLKSDQIQEAIRTLTNTMEATVAAQYLKACRAVLPAGTTIFDAANYKDLSNLVRELNKNGAPLANRSLVLGSDSAAAFRGNAQFTGANTAGTDDMQRNGILLRSFNMDVRESGQIKFHTIGTAANATTDGNAHAVGATTITLASAGTGSIVPGDIIAIEDDTNKYVVLTGDANVAGGGTITIAEPGLLKAIPAATKTITVESETERNMCFSRNAIHMAARSPAVPKGGDAAVDSVVLRDPYSGLAFRFAKYPQYYQNKWEVSIAWGVQVIKPQHLILLAAD